jgi:hypothetical protein
VKTLLVPALSPDEAFAREFRGSPAAPTPLPQAPTLEPALSERVIRLWRGRQAVEYRSSMVFTQLAVQLVEANAPLEATSVMLRMANDELRHADGCREVLRALGDDTPVEVNSSVATLAKHIDVTAGERALRNVIYTTCCSELVACARFVAALEDTTDPFFAAALKRLLADERLHAQFGFHYLVWAQPFLRANPQVEHSLGRYLAYAFAVLEGELAPAGHLHPIDAEGRAVGLECPVQARELFAETMEDAVVPGLEAAGLPAARAWRERSLVVTR